MSDKNKGLKTKAVKPSSFNISNGLIGSDLGDGEKEIVATNIIWDALKKGDEWRPFSFRNYLELRISGTANMDGLVLEDLHKTDKVLDKNGQFYSVNAKFFAVLAKYIKRPKKVKTFRELDAALKIGVEELIATMKDYVNSCAAISPVVVKALIERVDPSQSYLEVLLKLVKRGSRQEMKSGKRRTAEEYEDVADFLKAKINVLEEFSKRYGVNIKESLSRYTAVIHLISLAVIEPEKYGKGGNDNRFEDIERARQLEQATTDAWIAHDRHLTISGKSSIEGKISETIGIIKLLLSSK